MRTRILVTFTTLVLTAACGAPEPAPGESGAPATTDDDEPDATTLDPADGADLIVDDEDGGEGEGEGDDGDAGTAGDGGPATAHADAGHVVGVGLDAGSPSDAGHVVAADAGASPTTDAGFDGPPPDAGHAAADAGFVVVGDAGDGSGPGACAMTTTWPAWEGAEHIDAPTPIAYTHNPPTSGDHWPYWARWMIHDTAVEREFYVHNLEHGGIVFLYGPRASQAQIDALTDLYTATPLDPLCNGGDEDPTRRALVTFDPRLDDVVAVVAWGVVLEGECVDPAAIAAFVQTHRGHGTEDDCRNGWR